VTARVRVDLTGRGYDVVIGAGLLDRASELMALIVGPARLAVVCDTTVDALHGAQLARGLAAHGADVSRIVIAPGEGAKSFAGLEDLCGRLLALGLDRGDLVIAFGGGVVGDLAGFAAAIYKRGIDFVQIPTTLLAQVDSSVGGKTAIDTAFGKNLIGAFHQPRLVLADLDVLRTLPRREVLCGYAEVLKYGLLGDRRFFETLEATAPRILALKAAPLLAAVRRSVEMKAEIVAEDERESGRRALLNLGHTFAHALETETGYGERLKHGEAVALGCALAFRFSAALGYCAAEEAQRASAAIAAAGLPTRMDEIAGHPFAADALVLHMAQDKKAEGGALTFVLARRIGEAFIAKGVDRGRLREFLIEEGARP